MRSLGLAVALHLVACGSGGSLPDAPPPTDGTPDADVADPQQFCVDKETAVCARECSTGRYTVDMCASLCGSGDAIVARCAGVRWTPTCEPSRTETRECLDALGDTARIDTPSDMIAECQISGLCP
jgi:hypothetical protein